MASARNGVLQFYSASRSGPAGDGVGEQSGWMGPLPPNFRRVLSNSYEDVEPIIMNGRPYRTVEHAFQGGKFLVTGHDQEAYCFTTDSQDPIGLGSGLDARKALKLKRLSAGELAHWAEVKDDYLYDCWTEKFKHGTVPGTVLRNTGNAILNHYMGRGQGIERWVGLEELRAFLRDSPNGRIL